jgi:sialate O-acetylesterase
VGLIDRWVAALFAALLVCGEAAAQTPPLLHPLFTDHAVLQRDRPIAVWGWAAPRERVVVEFDGARIEARAAASGAWRAELPAHEAGGPYALSVQAGAARASVSDILVGDVYLCSGQSNMEFQTRYATNASTLLNAARSSTIRLFTSPRAVAPQPQSHFAEPAQWRTADEASVGDFSAVCYLFAREIEATAQAPIGLINASWGGTRIEAWMSTEALQRVGGLDAELRALALAIRDPDSAARRYDASLRAWWRAERGARQGWGADAYDDSGWRSFTPGGFWESSGEEALARFDGVAWFRTRFELTQEQASQSAELSLGPIDDIDVVYLNGRVVGAGGGWDTPRTYAISQGGLRAGANTLAVGVLDTGGGGGLWGGEDTRALRFADGSSVLLGPDWRYRASTELWDITAPPSPPWGGPNGFSALYNGMIAPLAPFGLRGVLWYQGESNAGDPAAYRRLLPGMMRDWREAFATPALPFLIVQLADFGAPASTPQRNSWGGLREAQRLAVAADAHAGLAVAVDIGDRFDIHPTQKTVVAQRLALLARHRIYGQDVADSGPAPVTAQRSGEIVTVTFANGPLVAYSASRPIAFELCDEARACRFVDAEIDGAVVRLDARGGPAAFVRYCWGDAPICNLYNDADLAATPFELAVQ